MPPNSASYRMADRLTDGKLAELLRVYRGAGDSFQTIARRLFADHGIEVTDQTINNWLVVLDGETVANEVAL